MRIISQDGMIDVPYDLVALSIGFNELKKEYSIYIRSKMLDEKPCIFATYSTENKAKKAMEMLHEVYLGKDRRLDLDDEGWIYQSRKTTDTYIFQFQADYEVV